MADNVYVDPGSGAGKVPVATDDVSGVHYPYVKLDVGADGAASHVVGTVPVSGTVTVNAGTGTMAVSGPVTDAELRASAVPVSAASLPLPSGAATAANQVFTNSYASSIDTKTPALGQALAAGSVPVVLTAAQATALAPLSTVTANLGTIGSAATEATLAGIKTGTDKIPSSPATAAKQPALGTAGTPSSDVITVQGVTSMTPLKTDGSGVTQPVSGTVTANAGSGTFAVSGPLTDTQLRASAVPISAASLPLPSSAATSTKQSDGTQKTQVVDGAGNVIGATANALDVNIKSGASSGTQYTEADTDASITGTAVMWEDTSDTLRAVSAAKPLPVNVVAGGAGDGAILDGVSSAIKATVLDYTNANPIAVRLSDTNGDYVSAGAGTQYTEDAAAAADPVGGALILVRADTPAATVSADGDNIAARGTNKGEQYVKHLDSIAVTDNGGSLTVDGSVTVSGTVTANAGSGTMAVSAASLPLPSGASTAAKQPALGTAGTASSDVITVQGIASMTALKVDGSAVTQPVSGTVTATGPLTDTQLRASAVPVSDGGSSLTVDGSVSVSGTATVTGNKAEDAAAADGDAGLPILGVRNDAAAARTSADGDYGMFALDSAGRVGISDLGGAVSVDDNGGSLTVDGAVTVTNATAANLKAEVTIAAAQTLATLTSITNVVHVDDNAGSLTVDGSVTANAGTNLNTSALALESGGNLATIAAAIAAEDSASADADKGVRMLAVRKAAPANTSGTDGDYEVPQMSAGRLWVSATVDAALPAGSNAIGKLATNDGVDIGDVTINNAGAGSAVNIQDGGNSITVDGTVSITANSAVNVAQINGVTPLMGAGNTGTGSPRVTIASDQASIPVAATLGAETTKVIGTVNIAAAQTVATVTTVSTVSGGGVAHDGADSGNPIKVGGRAISAEIAAVANNDRVDFVTDLCGKQIVLLGSNPENLVSGVITSAMTGTTSTSLVAAPGAGLRNYITQITVSNAHATVGTDVIIQDGSGGTTLYTIPAAAAYGGAAISFPVPLRQPTTNTALYCANVTTGASTKVSASGFKGA